MNNSDRLLGQLEATLKELHEDVKILREDVETLKTDFIQRGVVYRAAAWVVGICGPVLTLSLTYFINVLTGKH